jgi:nucleotide-binding universal stress UspA family protein
VADIVLGYDSSECSHAALAVALELARALGDRLVIAYAYAPPDSLRGEEYAEHRRALREIGEQVVADALERARDAEVEAEVALVPKKPADALVVLAEERSARLIVVGTHGEGPVAGALLGSVPHKLLHRSRVPVVVVPAAPG